MNNESKCYNFIKEVEQMKYFTTRQYPERIKNNLGPIIDGMFGLINIAGAVEDFMKISEEVKKFEEFQKELEKIIKKFNEHKDSILTDDDLFNNSLGNIIKKIKKGIKELEEDIENLNNLIFKIEAEIQECEKSKNISFASQIFSTILFGISIGNYMTTHNNRYLASGSAHAVGMTINSVNVVKYSSLIKDLKKLLGEAKNEREKMNNSIQEIKTFLSKNLKFIIEGFPST